MFHHCPSGDFWNLTVHCIIIVLAFWQSSRQVHKADLWLRCNSLSSVRRVSWNVSFQDVFYNLECMAKLTHGLPCFAEADAGPVQSEEDSIADTDYFDRQDLGRLRRRLRKGIEGFQRERELYLELVQSYLRVICCLSFPVMEMFLLESHFLDWPFTDNITLPLPLHPRPHGKFSQCLRLSGVMAKWNFGWPLQDVLIQILDKAHNSIPSLSLFSKSFWTRPCYYPSLKNCYKGMQVEDVLTNMKHGPPYRSSLHGETSPFAAYLEWYWKCALRGWALRYLPYGSIIAIPCAFRLGQCLPWIFKSFASIFHTCSIQ